LRAPILKDITWFFRSLIASTYEYTAVRASNFAVKLLKMNLLEII